MQQIDIASSRGPHRRVPAAMSQVRDAGGTVRADGRWGLLDDLASAAAAWGLKPRHLGVLRALLTILPRDAEPERRIVFPSNKVLATRLHGMPESTLRRHLAALVSSGLVRRRDSPNRKRYRVGRDADLVFGFDLSPFFDAAPLLRRRAAMAAAGREEIAEIRARCRIAATRLPAEARETALRTLRRKLDVEELRRLYESLDARPDDLPAARMAGPAAHSGRLIDPEEDIQTKLNEAAGTVARFATASGLNGNPRELLSRVLRFAGISEPGWCDLICRHGPAPCLEALSKTLPRLAAIRSPTAYLATCVRNLGRDPALGARLC